MQLTTPPAILSVTVVDSVISVHICTCGAVNCSYLAVRRVIACALSTGGAAAAAFVLGAFFFDMVFTVANLLRFHSWARAISAITQLVWLMKS